MRLGIYGGAFDPPHLAHLALARSAIEQFDLDELRILPTGHAWHKSRSLTASEHRIAMAELAFSELPQAKVDARETARSGASYTIDTLRELRGENPQAQLFVLMGQDQLAFFPQWHRYQEILQIATILVAARADSMPGNSLKDLKNQVKIPHQLIYMPESPLSATHVRRLLAQHLPMTHLVKPDVARYIERNGLYANP